MSRIRGAGEDDGDEDVDDDDDGEDGIAEEEEMGASVVPERWDVLGLGQAMVNFYFNFSFLFGSRENVGRGKGASKMRISGFCFLVFCCYPDAFLC